LGRYTLDVTGIPAGVYRAMLGYGAEPPFPPGYAVSLGGFVPSTPTPETQTPTPPTPETQTPTPGTLIYVATGDSVPDGEDLGGCPDGTNCKQKAYPQYFAQRLTAALSPDVPVSTRNVACSGFTTDQFIDAPDCRGTPYPSPVEGKPGNQLTEASADEGDLKVVTITVGADNLINLLRLNKQFLGCTVHPKPKDPKKCEEALAATLQNVVDDLAVILPQISQQADLVIVTGYYHVFEVPTDPKKGETRRKVNGYIDSLNSTIQSAVNKPGLNNVHYLDLVTVFAGHGVFSDDPWIVKPPWCGESDDEHKLTLTCLVPVHPSETGQQKIAEAMWDRFGFLFED
jgi:lysophospholipase L1-like esterase